MDKLIGCAAIVFRLAFLPLRKHILTKKRKIALLLASNIVMMYAVFIIAIPPRKSIFTQVNEAYAGERAKLDNEEAKIHEIILRHAKNLLHPNMITIVPTRTLEAERLRDSIDKANGLSEEEERFLLGVGK